MSFVDTGLFEQLEESTKWVPAFELIERIKKEEKKIRDQAVQEEKEKTIKKVVKNARRKGLSVDDIAELTGLTPEEIAKIK